MINPLQQYFVVTANYWAFTLTDGALRILVLLFFYQLGYSPLEIATLFILYEVFGIVTNFVGGWLGARVGLHITMNMGIALQVVALVMLTVDPQWLTMLYVMLVQALAGIAKDLNKMSAKSAIKSLVDNNNGQLYRWVSILTGSKNALKGVGFFVGALLYEVFGFANAMWFLVALLMIALMASLFLLNHSLGKATNKPKFKEMFSPSAQVNWLSAARLFLFGARDIWFAVALPLYLQAVLGWSYIEVGAFLALWVIGYGFVQAVTPKMIAKNKAPSYQTASFLAAILGVFTLVMALLLELQPAIVIVSGLAIFGVLFAMNSAVHSFLIVEAASTDGASKEVGFYYMANAAGRLLGMLLSGYLFQEYGMVVCLIASGLFILAAMFLVRFAKPEAKMV